MVKETAKSPVRLTSPLHEEAVRALQAGDLVLYSGSLFTARDAAHQRLAAGESPPVSFLEAVIYHCGPVVVKSADNSMKVTAAGPTTSIREEQYMAGIMEKYQLRAIIGKGGMGEQTLQACRRFGCVYLHAVGGAASLLAKTVRQVAGVYWLEQGEPEAVWQLVVEDFPAIVTMDSHGCSLHRQLTAASRENLQRLLRNRIS